MVDRRALPSPFRGVESIEELLELPYFDFLACVGVGSSAHPGGLRSTQQLLSTAKVRLGDRILECGCGLGATTTALLSFGVTDITVVERSERMISAMMRNCRVQGLPLPSAVCASIEQIDSLGVNAFDFVLCECILGFVDSKRNALSQIRRVLKPSGRLGVIDYHYAEPPPDELRRRLSSLFGGDFEPLTEEAWKDLFSAFFAIDSWSYLSPPSAGASKEEFVRGLGEVMERMGHTSEVRWLDGEAVRRIVDRWMEIDGIFAENRSLLRGHLGVLQPRE